MQLTLYSYMNDACQMLTSRACGKKKINKRDVALFQFFRGKNDEEKRIMALQNVTFILYILLRFKSRLDLIGFFVHERFSDTCHFI